jgi:predicted nucleic acid-binding protein
MALTHIVDTSVLTRMRNPAVRDAVEPKARDGQLARAGISDLEVGYSARNASEWDDLARDLDSFELVETTAAHLRRARQVQRLLAGKHQRGRSKHQRGRKVPDLLVAAAAEDSNLAVLHYDADFDRIAAVTGQACEWVVPAGSVD